MLGKLNKAAVNTVRTNGTSVLSVIGYDVHITGNIETSGEMQIDGQVDGDVFCGSLIVGENACITGEINANLVKLHGELRGKVNAATVSIARTARVVGDIIHESVEIEAGAQLDGRLLRRDASTTPATSLPAPEKPAAATAADE